MNRQQRQIKIIEILNGFDECAGLIARLKGILVKEYETTLPKIDPPPKQRPGFRTGLEIDDMGRTRRLDDK